MRVLIVENDVNLAAYMKRGLERAGFAVDVVGDGDEVLRSAVPGRYDAIVLDAELPGLSGYDACGQIRRRGQWLPIVIVAASDADADQTQALSAGADEALPRHFHAADLVGRLRATMARRAGGREDVVHVGDLELDPVERRVRVAGTSVDLTPTEFCILEFLMRRPGDVASKHEILDSCWEWAFQGEPNIVEVYIGLLRKKIDAPFDRAQIQTVRGAGYRLAVAKAAGRDTDPQRRLP